VVAVVVTEHTDKGAVEFCEMGDGEGGDVVACVKHYFSFM